MANAAPVAVVAARVKEPRNLEAKETRENIEHWFDQFRQYWKRDDRARHFMLPTTSWNTKQENWGLQAEGQTSKLKRTAEEMQVDLEDLLDTVSGHLPFRYINSSLKSNTTCWKKVKEAVFEIYGCQTTASTALDFAKIKKLPEETYRQMFERMVAHAQLHLPLPEDEFTLGGIKVETTGEKMTVALYNHIVIDWLRAIDPRMIGIVQVAYSKDLKKKDCQLYSLMPDIAQNVDELLNREESTIQRVAEQVEEISIRRFRESGRGRGRVRGRGQDTTGSQSRKTMNPCPKCVTLQSEMKTARFSAYHDPADCPNKRVYVRQVTDQVPEADETNEGGEDQFEDFDDDYEDGEREPVVSTKNKLNFKVTEVTRCREENCCQHHHSQEVLFRNSQHVDLSDRETEELRARLSRVEDLATKAESPALEAEYQGTPLIVVADSGAELNCLDKDLAIKLKIPFRQSRARARAAGDSSVTVSGQTDSDFIIQTYFHGKKVDINLQRTVIVDRLGTDILIGEPGLAYNGIKTDATHRKIELRRNGCYRQKPYLTGYKSSYQVCRVMERTTIYPGETLHWKIPPDLPRDGVFSLSPLRHQAAWYNPGIYKATEGHLNIVNTSEEVVNVKKHRHIGELRVCVAETVKKEKVRKIESLPQCQFKYKIFGVPHETKAEPEIDLDPDNVMPAEAKQEIRDISNEFAEIFTKAPGKYNGYYGRVNNTLNFATKPPPNRRVYQPQYSEEMKRKQAELMDKLYDFGVLRTPEEIGVSVETISPSLLVAKSEPGEYRLVTDLSNINIHIKKAPAVSPIISEAKAMLAKKRLMIHVDLSNYFFQSGMTREDCQYLGTVHPYRGTMVYVVEPQGLRNASEHGYEVLARVYGDLCQTGAMTRMADSLFVLGDDYAELARNYREVLKRARLAGLTFKPGKTVVCPKKTILFGWQLNGSEWRPTSHTLSALSRAPAPTTVKGMRSFLGSFKQFTECVRDYAQLLHDLDLLCAGRSSAERLVWTEELTKKFETAKAATARLEGVHIPRPDDILTTYSDYSEEHKAIGGRLEIKRKVDGKVITLHGGYVSQILDSLKSKWLPCEGEALGIRLVLEHFAPFLRENKEISIHYTDNSPCVQAWKRSLQGAFSSSARISQFLTGLSALPVELRHKAGKLMHSADFISRNPIPCGSPEKCQMCRFARDLQKEGDNTKNIRAITVKDVMDGETLMPYTQRRTWLGTQLKDSVHTQLKKLINTSQLPDKRKTRGDATKLKQLHSLYVKNELKIDSRDGLVMVKHPEGHFGGWVISIPYQLLPGLANALHITLQHPSRAQLASLMARYFYCPGHSSIIHEVSDSCVVCRSLKRLPKSVLANTTEKVAGLGTEFAVDVMERNSQKIFLAREKLSQFTWLLLIKDQTKETLRSAILKTILPWAHQAGATVRCDGATGFASLAAESEVADSILAKNNIKIDIGRTNNRNKNPVAENAIQECEREILRHKPHVTTLTEDDLCCVQKSMNGRVRNRGLAAKEILTRRDLVTQEPKDISDQKLSEEQQANRQAVTNRDKPADPIKPGHEFHVGDLVHQVDQLQKHQPRQTFIVTALVEDMIEIQKLHTQFRQKKYRVYPEEIVPAVNNNNQLFHHRRRDASDNNSQVETSAVQSPPTPPTIPSPVIIRPKLRPRREAAKKAEQAWSTMMQVKVRKANNDWKKPRAGGQDNNENIDCGYDIFYTPDNQQQIDQENEQDIVGVVLNPESEPESTDDDEESGDEDEVVLNPFAVLNPNAAGQRARPVQKPSQHSAVQLGAGAPVQNLAQALDGLQEVLPSPDRPRREVEQPKNYKRYGGTGERQ